MSADDLLVLEDVHASIGVSHVLQGVSFSVPRGQVTVVLGRNGVGKTTTLRAILGLVERSGRIELDGRRIETLETSRIARSGVGYVPENRDVFVGLTVEENLGLAVRRGQRQRRDVVDELFPELRERARQMAGTLSGGQQQMVSLARGLINDNQLLLVDEPTKGLAPRVVTSVVAALERAKGLSTVLMVEQNIDVARRLADHVVVMGEGRVISRGGPEILRDDAALRLALGVARHGHAGPGEGIA